MQPTLVIFDLDGVLYDLNREQRLMDLARLSGKSAQEVHAAIWASGFEAAASAGAPNAATDYLDEFARLLGYPINRDAWTAIHKAMMKPRPQTLALASSVSENADAVLLDNGAMAMKEALESCAPEAMDIFGDMAHASAEFGASMSDPALFCKLCERYGHPPRTSLFVSAQPERLEAARAAGLKILHYTDAANLRACLSEFNLLDSGGYVIKDDF